MEWEAAVGACPIPSFRSGSLAARLSSYCLLLLTFQSPQIWILACRDAASSWQEEGSAVTRALHSAHAPSCCLKRRKPWRSLLGAVCYCIE